ncbi:MAG: leucine-rich repeat domain-containing protein [Clostridia bacterium]|nr:leucine-rich repeat domain-containing protein [Clostridia bacterium]
MRNFNKAAAVMLAVLILAAVIPFSANAFEREGDFYYSVNTAAGTATIREYCGRAIDVTVPDTLGGYPVTAVGSYSFSTESSEAGASIESVSLPETVTQIGERAFWDCEALSEINFPDGLTEIGDGAFKDCYALESFTVPKGITKLNCNAIPPAARTVYFNAENCTFTGLTADVSDSEVNGYYSPFYDTAVEKVVIGNTVKKIPDYFFYSYENVNRLVLPNSVTDIGKFAFAHCSASHITFSSNLVSVEEGAFYSTGITLSGDTFPDSLRMIGSKAFEKCSRLKQVNIPDSVVYIDDGAFANCTNLHTLKMSANVKYIPDYTFNGCSSLSDFVWNSDVKLIGSYAFAYCAMLSDFDFVGVEKLYESSFIESGISFVALGEGQNEENAKLETVEAASFKSCSELETLSVGGNVTTIKSEAFAQCESLETAIISNSVSSIAIDAFDECSSLTIYCMENSYAHEYAVENSIPVSTFVIAPIPNQTYTGSEIEPELSVKVSGKPLEKSTDFTVKYTDNVNVGTAKATVKGKDIYKPLTSVANFTIITASISQASVAEIPTQSYTGQAVEPTLTVTCGGNILKEGKDYTAEYKNNTQVGTATVVLKGTGNYSGSLSVNFTVKQLSFFQQIINSIVSFFNALTAWFEALFTSTKG